jgi:hypothetical protein
MDGYRGSRFQKAADKHLERVKALVTLHSAFAEDHRVDDLAL